jgi:hypothetical protein
LASIQNTCKLIHAVIISIIGRIFKQNGHYTRGLFQIC